MTRTMKSVIGAGVLGAGLVCARSVVPAMLTSHDLPETVDNGPIRITRAAKILKKEGEPPKHIGGDYKHWEIHHSAPLTRLNTWVWDKDGNYQALATEVSLSGVDDVVFGLENMDKQSKRPKTAAMMLSRDPWWKFTLNQKVRWSSDDLEFDLTNGDQPLHAKDAADDVFRIKFVRVNNTVICLRNSDKPEIVPDETKCAFNNAEWRVQVGLCVKPDDCDSPRLP